MHPTPSALRNLRRALTTAETHSIPSLLSLLADPTRFRIVKALMLHPKLCVTDLAELLHITPPSVCHHLDLLKRAGVVGSERHGQTQCYELLRTPESNFIRSLIAA